MRRALSLGCALSLAACSGPQALDERVPAQPGGLLSVDLDLGDEAGWERVSLEVRSHDADEVWAVADVSGLGTANVAFRLERDERGLRLYGSAGGLLAWIFGGPVVAVRIFVPRVFSADLRCGSGPIRVEDLTGPLRARTRGSAIEVRAVDGNLTLRSGAGAITASEVRGDVAVRTSGGPVELRWITGDVEVRSDAGSVRLGHVSGGVDVRADSGEIELADVGGPVAVKVEQGAISASFTGAPAGLLETRSGSVEVLVPALSFAGLDLRSAHGSVEVAPGLVARGERAEDRFVGQLNGGGAPLRVFTARGNVRLAAR
jgi:hypothetical protein